MKKICVLLTTLIFNFQSIANEGQEEAKRKFLGKNKATSEEITAAIVKSCQGQSESKENTSTHAWCAVDLGKINSLFALKFQLVNQINAYNLNKDSDSPFTDYNTMMMLNESESVLLHGHNSSKVGFRGIKLHPMSKLKAEEIVTLFVETINRKVEELLN